MKRKAIHLTFKNNITEDDLYEWICKNSTDKCCFIKDILLEAKKNRERNSRKIIKGFLKLDN